MFVQWKDKRYYLFDVALIRRLCLRLREEASISHMYFFVMNGVRDGVILHDIKYKFKACY